MPQSGKKLWPLPENKVLCITFQTKPSQAFFHSRGTQNRHISFVSVSGGNEDNASQTLGSFISEPAYCLLLRKTNSLTVAAFCGQTTPVFHIERTDSALTSRALVLPASHRAHFCTLTVSHLAFIFSFSNLANSLRSWIIISSFQMSSRAKPIRTMPATTPATMGMMSGPAGQSETRQSGWVF